MPTANEELLTQLLAKSALTTGSLGTLAGGTGVLAPEQAAKFLQIAVQQQVIAPDANVVVHTAPKWQQPKAFFGGRVLAAGTESTRLSSGQQANPTLQNVEISTNLLRGEVPVSDEFLEDNIEREGFADTLMELIASAVGRDLEELYIRGDTTSTDTYLAVLNALIFAFQQAGTHTVSATPIGQDYQTLFLTMLEAMPIQFRRDPTQLRFYVPVTVADGYRNQIASRGTPLGDEYLMGSRPLAYGGVPVLPVPMMIGTGVGNNTDAGNKILLTHPKNIYIGFRRQVRIETFRDPREGTTSFVVTVRTDVKLGHIDASVIATNVT